MPHRVDWHLLSPWRNLKPGFYAGMLSISMSVCSFICSFVCRLCRVAAATEGVPCISSPVKFMVAGDAY